MEVEVHIKRTQRIRGLKQLLYEKRLVFGLLKKVTKVEKYTKS